MEFEPKHSTLTDILIQFGINAPAVPYGEGLINDTYFAEDKCGKYVLQRINHNVFKQPYRLMENFIAVTEHIRDKIIKRGDDPDRGTLTAIKTTDGKSLYKTADGNYYRTVKHIGEAVTYQRIERVERFYDTARAVGRFICDLADFPAETLHETIPDFHNTGVRLDGLIRAAAEDIAGRKSEAVKELEFALERKSIATVITDALQSGEIPLRVTHNDTKLSNVLFDAVSGQPLCMIDLDTVMSGSLLYDFGDAIRSGANTASEGERDLTAVSCNLELFEAFAKGFLEEIIGSITQRERELLAFSARLITYETGLRFLTDYLNGDIYFKTDYPTHNLDRCRAHFKLVADMEEKAGEMEEIVRSSLEYYSME